MALRYDNAHRIAGRFQEKEFGVIFEYAELDPSASHFEYDKAQGATHVVFVGPWSRPQPGIDRGTRAAIVKRTVAYVAVDEDENGRAVWEKWHIAKHYQYERGGE